MKTIQFLFFALFISSCGQDFCNLTPDKQVEALKPQLEALLKEGEPILTEYKTLSEFSFHASDKVEMRNCLERIRIRKNNEGGCQATLTELEFIRGGDIWLGPQRQVEKYIPQIQLDDNGKIGAISLSVSIQGENQKAIEEPIGLDQFVDLDKVQEWKRDKEEMLKQRKIESEKRIALEEKRRIEGEKLRAEQDKKFAKEQRQKAKEEQKRKQWEANNPFLVQKGQSVKAIDISYTFAQNEYKANQSLKGRKLKVYGRIADIKVYGGVSEVHLEGHEVLHFVVFKLSSQKGLSHLSVGREVVLEGICTGMDEVMKLFVEFEDGKILVIR